MSELRTIKKYPNRRLYDTARSCYVTLQDVRDLVLSGVEFSVIEKKSQHDITSAVLLQVIAEQERGDHPLLRRDFLARIIRSHGTSEHAEACNALEQSLQFGGAHLTNGDRAAG